MAKLREMQEKAQDLKSEQDQTKALQYQKEYQLRLRTQEELKVRSYAAKCAQLNLSRQAQLQQKAAAREQLQAEKEDLKLHLNEQFQQSL